MIVIKTIEELKTYYAHSRARRSSTVTTMHLKKRNALKDPSVPNFIEVVTLT